MRSAFIVTPLFLFCYLLPLADAHADLPVESLIRESDVVCVASFVSLQELAERPSFSTPNVPYATTLVTLHAHRVLKGNLPTDNLLLKAYSIDWKTIIKQGGGTFSGYREDFTDFVAGRNYLVFAKQQGKTTFFTLVNPYRSGSSAWEIGPLSPDLQSSSSLVKGIYLHFLSTVFHPRLEVRIISLSIVDDLGNLLWDKPELDLNGPQAGLYKELTLLARNRVIPAVLHLTKSRDDKTKTQALFAAAFLQVVEVIPDLVALSESKASGAKGAASFLEAYQVKAAVPVLVSLLRHKSLEVRTSALAALRTIADRRSVPFLIDALSDPDVEIRYETVRILSGITGVYEPPELGRFPDDAKEFARRETAYQTFWRDWASQHRPTLQRFRLQLQNKAKELERK